ncbi:alpha/beta fold hydrolase [Ornithinibacillus scapharcae]|uniref:alpha/beta fold hydrolase n=1 Tax=Ornithinibacillus scapharcae TaxID=1147159 RepID=UPI000225BCFC|nr:alpha/beta hydrolase [Ornithinibacillus scapharcae]
MKAEKTLKTVIDVIGFPFTLTNLLLTKNRQLKEPGQLIKRNDRMIHAIASRNEEAEVTVIFDSGLSCCSLDWCFIQPQVSKYARTVSFDRAGYGWSSPSEQPYTSEDVVHDLVHILENLKLAPPYILVGHSFGGLNMRLFASKYPEKIASLILVDAVHENRYLSEEWDAARQQSHRKNLQIFRFGYLTSGIGLPKLLKQPVGRKYLPDPFREHARYIGFHPKSYEAVYQEFLMSEESAMQVNRSKALPDDLSLTVISSNNSDPTWIEHQNLLCNLTKNARQIKTVHSHSLHLENPELVIDVIKEAIRQKCDV